MSEADSSARPRSRRRVRRVCIVLGLVGLAVWFLLPPNVERDVVVLARDEDGTLREQDGGNESGLDLAAHLGQLEAQNQTLCGTSSIHSNPAFFAANSIVIINQSDDLLLERVGTELLELLKETLPVDRLEYYPSGHLPDPGERSPDFYLLLGLGSKQHSGLLNKTLDATVTAQFGTTLASGAHTTSDHLTPPIVRLNADITVEHHSTYVGVESSSAAYTLQGRDIAKQIASHVSKTLDSERAKHGPLPEMPEVLVNPDFTPVPEFAFLQSLNATLVTSTFGLMLHNDTFWRITTEKTPDELFAQMVSELTEQEWRIDHKETEFPRSAHLRAVDGPRVLQVFPVNRNQLPMSADEPLVGPVDYFIHYADRIDRKTLRSVFDKELAEPTPDVNLLMAFRGVVSSEQFGNIVSLLEDQKPGTVDGWMTLADHYSSHEDTDQCLQALRKLKCFESLVSDSGRIAGKIREIAKKHEFEKSDYNNPSREDWLRFGLRELVEGEPIESIEFGFDSPVGFFAVDAESKTHIFGVEIRKTNSAGSEASHFHSSDGSRSWSTGTIFHTSAETSHHHSFGRGPNGSRVELVTDKLGPDRFRVTAELIPQVKPRSDAST